MILVTMTSLLAACSSTVGGGGEGGGGPQPDPTPNACWPNDVDYSVCTGSTFFPDGTCLQGSCAGDELTTNVFAEWALQARTASGLDEANFWNRVQVSKVEPSGAFIRIEVVYVMDWLRARDAFSVPTDGFSPVPTAQEIAKAVKLEIQPSKWQVFGQISNPASVASVRNAFSTCQCNMKVDWCHIRLNNNMPSQFVIPGIVVVDESANQCKDADIDVPTADMVSCTDVPCAVN